MIRYALSIAVVVGAAAHAGHPVRASRAPAERAAEKPDPAAALVGFKVRVRTVDGGLYGGTLQSIDANALVLRIDLPRRTLSYTLPRRGVADVVAAESAP